MKLVRNSGFLIQSFSEILCLLFSLEKKKKTHSNVIIKKTKQNKVTGWHGTDGRTSPLHMMLILAHLGPLHMSLINWAGSVSEI